MGSSRSPSTGDYTLYVLTDDHSPTTNRATTLTLNTSVSGTINPADNVDYFSLVISTPTFVNIFTTGNLDTVGSLLVDRTNSILQLEFDDQSGEENNFLISTHLDPGTYYIQVGSLSTGNYTFYVLTDDHSNTIETATTLRLNTSVSGTIDPADDVDYFSLVISTPTFVNIFTTGNLDTIGSLLINSVGNFLQFEFDDQFGEENNFLISDQP